MAGGLLLGGCNRGLWLRGEVTKRAQNQAGLLEGVGSWRMSAQEPLAVDVVVCWSCGLVLLGFLPSC